MKTAEELLKIEDEINYKYAPLLEEWAADVFVNEYYTVEFRKWPEITFADREDIENFLDFNSWIYGTDVTK